MTPTVVAEKTAIEADWAGFPMKKSFEIPTT